MHLSQMFGGTEHRSCAMVRLGWMAACIRVHDMDMDVSRGSQQALKIATSWSTSSWTRLLGLLMVWICRGERGGAGHTTGSRFNIEYCNIFWF